DAHGLLLLVLLHHLTALVKAATAAHAVGQHRLLAAGAVVDGQRRQVMVTPPHALAGFRRSSLGNGHDEHSRAKETLSETAIVGTPVAPVKAPGRTRRTPLRG